MRIVEGEEHDPLCATYQTLEVARLNDALKECGVSDRNIRRAVCEAYFFNSGHFLDSCWFSESSRRFRVGIYFAELDASNTLTGTVYLPAPSVGTMFHEYAHGAAAWLFDDHAESVEEIEVGDTE